MPLRRALSFVLCCLPALLPSLVTAQQQEAAVPGWLAALFPYAGTPDRLERRLSRTGAAEFPVRGGTAGVVTVQLRYPGLDGTERTGRARIFLPAALRENPRLEGKIPLIHAAGYEVNEAQAAGHLARGYAVCTPHAEALNPLGRGPHLDRAILNAVSALPWVDRNRVIIQGGSAGGWMTLMVAADAFPLLCAMPDVPPIHWGYNAAFIGENQVHAAPPPGSETPRLPILRIVGIIADQSRTTYGIPYDHPGYLAVSPLAHLETLTSPTLAVFSTADMLVPIDQVSPRWVRPRDAAAFPPGFWISMTPRFPAINKRRTLLEALPASRREVFSIPADAGRPRQGAAGGSVATTPLPFSRKRTWSVVMVDEGAPEPGIGHFKYQWNFDHEPFRRWAEEQGIRPDQLTEARLRRLMQRYQGRPWVAMRARPGGTGEEREVNLLDYPEAERRDVLLGLRAFAQDDRRARHLARLYGELPSSLRPLGRRLGDGSPDGVRAALASVP